MLETPYKHNTIRKLIVAFGQLFSNIKIQRTNETTQSVEQLIDVPISYGNKEKWYSRLKEEPNIDTRVLITLPRIGFEIVGMEYDARRKLNKFNQYRACSPTANGAFLSTYTPSPYMIDIQMFVMTKTLDDMFQIIEQIVPYFGPQYTLSINNVEEIGMTLDVPITLERVEFTDSYAGPMENRREIVGTLTFNAAVEFVGPTKDDSDTIILHTKAKIDAGNVGREVDTDVVGDPAGVYAITEDFFDIPVPIT